MQTIPHYYELASRIGTRSTDRSTLPVEIACYSAGIYPVFLDQHLGNAGKGELPFLVPVDDSG